MSFSTVLKGLNSLGSVVEMLSVLDLLRSSTEDVLQQSIRSATSLHFHSLHSPFQFLLRTPQVFQIVCSNFLHQLFEILNLLLGFVEDEAVR